jgi:hypothetical protein
MLCFLPENKNGILLGSQLGGHHSRSGCLDEEKNLLPLLGIASRFLDYFSYNPVSMPTDLPMLSNLVVPVTRTPAVRDSSLHLYSHNVHHRVNNSPPMKSILGLTITCNVLPHNCFKINLIISCNIRLNRHGGLLPSDFPAKTLHIISAPPFMPHAQNITFSLIL